ncbi:hypothetical protein Bca52824_039615 [Brassica carinata]|uniref:Uncharacterized protein n=1 Tax=Brassica carinata TaxID=52824 RepID=A0A8X7RRD7_BRACI|nr:hypothetical protein Bca52824_039615 [Brassica carinata]
MKPARSRLRRGSVAVPCIAPSAPHAAAQQDPGSCGSSIGSTTRSRASPFLQLNPRRGHSTWFTKSKNGISRSINRMMYSMLRFGYQSGV